MQRINDQFMIAVYDNDIELQKELINAGADINYRDGSPLYGNAAHCNREMVEYLIKMGADIHIETDWPLRTSLTSGPINPRYLEASRILIENGANIHAYYDEPLYNSVKYGTVEFVEYIFSHLTYPYPIKFIVVNPRLTNLIKEFEEDQFEVIKRCRHKVVPEHVRWFLYTVMICDDYYKIKSTNAMAIFVNIMV